MPIKKFNSTNHSISIQRNLIHHPASKLTFLQSFLVPEKHIVIRVFTVKSKQMVFVPLFKIQFALNHIKSQTNSHIEHIFFELICSKQGQSTIFRCCLQLVNQLFRANKSPVDEKATLAIGPLFFVVGIGLVCNELKLIDFDCIGFFIYFNNCAGFLSKQVPKQIKYTTDNCWHRAVDK